MADYENNCGCGSSLKISGFIQEVHQPQVDQFVQLHDHPIDNGDQASGVSMGDVVNSVNGIISHSLTLEMRLEKLRSIVRTGGRLILEMETDVAELMKAVFPERTKPESRMKIEHEDDDWKQGESEFQVHPILASSLEEAMVQIQKIIGIDLEGGGEDGSD